LNALSYGNVASSSVSAMLHHLSKKKVILAFSLISIYPN